MNCDLEYHFIMLIILMFHCIVFNLDKFGSAFDGFGVAD